MWRCFLVAGAGLLLGMAPALPGQEPFADWEKGEGWRQRPLKVAAGGKPGFVRMDPESSGVLFTNRLEAAYSLTNQILLNGSGVTAGDVDGDGQSDLYFSALVGPNRLFRNLGGWRFEDVTEHSGAALKGLPCSGAVLADLDGDRDLDLIVNTVGHGSHLLLNNGAGQFTSHRFSPLNRGRAGMTTALGDLDGDGFLDVYIANYRSSALMDMPSTHFQFATVEGRKVITHVDGRPVSLPDLAQRFTINEKGHIEELGEPDAVYRNLGGTNFSRVSFTGGAFLDAEGRPLGETPFDWGLSVLIRDLNRDQRADIYVCNDFDSIDRVWLGQEGFVFRALPVTSLRKSSLFSMGIDVADINRDGLDDLFVLDMRPTRHSVRMDMMGDRKPPSLQIGQLDDRPAYMMNTLFLNRGGLLYDEIARYSGVAASDWSWTAMFLDVDLDGYEDLLVANGHERASRSLDATIQLRRIRTEQNLSRADVLASRHIVPRMEAPNIAFRNRGDLTFARHGPEWGFDFNGVSHGMARVDLDGDGDLDLAVNNLNDAAGLYRNTVAEPRVAVRLRGRPPNTQGIGARITLLGGAVRQSQVVIAGGRYLSGDDPLLTFAAGGEPAGLRLEVQWPDGRQSMVTNVQPDHLYEIDQPEGPAGEARPEALETLPAGWFLDVSSALDHRHVDAPFKDRDAQPLLLRGMAQPGPGVTWLDWNDDGHEDLLVGSGRGGTPALLMGDGQGGFARVQGGPFGRAVTRDLTTLLPVPWSGEGVAVLAGSSNYEDGLAFGGMGRIYRRREPRAEDVLPAQPQSVGPLAMADLDGDGDLDLFVGGRQLPGRYPEPADSLIFLREGKEWVLDQVRSSALRRVGLVRGATFTDLDLDGDPDLVLACEWGPVRVFDNIGKTLKQATSDWGLDPYRGWWNGVVAGDFNGDNRMDLLASNGGLNRHHHPPLRLYYGDFDGNGSLDLLEAYRESASGPWLPTRHLDDLAKGWPLLVRQFRSYEQFGQASIDTLLGDARHAAQWQEVTWLQTTLFLNQGARFQAVPLPAEAQFTSAYGLAVADYDGDGREDVFLSQNFFATQDDVPRQDGGRGLLLFGDGRGGFRAATPRESGLLVLGEQRGCAPADYDEDGRTDLVVTQNGAATRLFRNQKGRAGLRVRVRGGPDNPFGIGARLRTGGEEGWGPAREIAAGCGYWSCPSTVQVLYVPTGEPTRLEVRWPGSPSRVVRLPEEVREVTVTPDGKLAAMR